MGAIAFGYKLVEGALKSRSRLNYDHRVNIFSTPEAARDAYIDGLARKRNAVARQLQNADRDLADAETVSLQIYDPPTGHHSYYDCNAPEPIPRA